MRPQRQTTLFGNQLLVATAALLVMAMTATAVASEDAPRLEFEKYVLDNGLQVILHEDHSIPMVTVNIWYHVGSKNEKPGRTGFAHLFEHMMFQGSEHYNDDYFLPLEKIGATVNGSTTEDRTNYWESVPSTQLELALWLESDRMGSLLPAMTEERLENQRDVVKNEKRQGMNQPYAKSDELLRKLLFPDEHPYSWTVIGSMEDLSAASLEDVSDFFRSYYTPNNASLCIAGDFDVDNVKQRVQKYFGPIPSGPPVDRLKLWRPELGEVRRFVAEDAVELPRLYSAWLTPGTFQVGDAEADLLADILSNGKTSRLYRKLVYDLQIAQDVTASQRSRELGGFLAIQATARPGHTLAELEAVIDEEVRRLASEGITEQELQMAKASYETGFIRALQRTGGFGGKADLLNFYNVYTGDPGYMPSDLERYRAVTTADLQQFAQRSLDLQRRAILHIVPQGTLQATGEAPDRSTLPTGTHQAEFAPPQVQRTTLSNGLELHLISKHELPLVELYLTFHSGWAADPADKPGAAALTSELLDEGTGSRNALQISSEIRTLGARLATGSFFDGSIVNLNILKKHLDAGLDLMGDLVRNPSFPAEELERQRQIYLGRIQQEGSQPLLAAVKAYQRLAFGLDHPYAQPFTGSGTVSSLQALTRDDLVRFHKEHYVPGNAAVLIVGDLTLTEAKEKLQKAFAGWKGGGVTRRQVSAPQADKRGKFYLVDRPGAPQSFIVGGQTSLTRNHPDYLAFTVMNLTLAGQFTSRLNMNLREDKGYTYGARADLRGFREAGVYILTAPVHTQFTKEAVVEILKELNDVKGNRPLTKEELQDSKNNLSMGYSNRFETYDGIAAQLLELVLYNLPQDEWQTHLTRVRAIDADQIRRIVTSHLQPDDMIFVIVGDVEKIKPGLEELNLGEIVVLTPEELSR